ncbi:PDZ domain-containing protein [Blastopirellula sp. JC732]|uniref:PDZ domain-containing protein n=1 Tax=Blastopirellula sediminis TaxID=2894196 RepID=A0A9X1MQT5_9BACT|nr:PDZ domain-containing protein [Blastopirellula sediminis]MCC9606350.1 PDZ domain-containing protein [Blastopirellula sediminis]MCC9630352.1 PDZ domain-containing protein [Blastopirellula sediminis]
MKLDWYSKGLMLAAMAATFGGGNVLMAQESGDAKVVEAKPAEEAPAADEAKSEDQVTERYWIGAKMTAEVPSLLKRHLPQLAEKGVFVEGVFAGSPAEEAGLEAEDVVLELNGQPMVDARKLVDAVREGEGKTLKFVVLHNGKETAVDVTPRKMTQEDVLAIAQSSLMQGAESDARMPMRMRFFGPGQMMPQPGVMPEMRLMDKSTGETIKIRVSREGDGPAKVHVEHNGNSYDVDAEHIDDLPKEIRPMVTRALQSGAFGPHGELDIDSMLPHGPEGPMVEGMLQQQLQDIRRMLEEMKAQMRGQMQDAPQQPKAEDDQSI